jgi:hypothetical protein
MSGRWSVGLAVKISNEQMNKMAAALLVLARDSTIVRSWLYSPVSYSKIIVSLGCRPAERGTPPL